MNEDDLKIENDQKMKTTSDMKTTSKMKMTTKFKRTDFQVVLWGGVVVCAKLLLSRGYDKFKNYFNFKNKDDLKNEYLHER